MFRLYIGANNKTHLLSDIEVEKIVYIVSDYFDSFTYLRAKGVYQRQEEDTLIVTIATKSEEDITPLVQRLCVEMKQESVGLEHNNSYKRLFAKS